VIMDVELPQVISRIVFRCSEQAKTELVSKMQIREGSMLTEELLQQARETAGAYNERLAVLVRLSLRQEDRGRTFPGQALNEGVNVVIWDRAMPPERIRKDGSEHNSLLIEKPMPIDGGDEVSGAAVVKLAIIVGKDGSVVEIDPLAAPDPLISSAVDEVRGREYRPTLLNGLAVEVETTVEVAFPGGEIAARHLRASRTTFFRTRSELRSHESRKSIRGPAAFAG
jgi:hypothetical protein